MLASWRASWILIIEHSNAGFEFSSDYNGRVLPRGRLFEITRLSGNRAPSMYRCPLCLQNEK